MEQHSQNEEARKNGSSQLQNHPTGNHHRKGMPNVGAEGDLERMDGSSVH